MRIRSPSYVDRFIFMSRSPSQVASPRRHPDCKRYADKYALVVSHILNRNAYDCKGSKFITCPTHARKNTSRAGKSCTRYRHMINYPCPPRTITTTLTLKHTREFSIKSKRTLGTLAYKVLRTSRTMHTPVVR